MDKKLFIGKELNLYKDSLTLDQTQRDVIFGILLGDASMECRLNKPVYAIKVEQALKNESYVIHLYEILKPYIGMVPTYRAIKASGNFKDRSSIWFRTYRHISFKYYFDLFYDIKDGKLVKKLPSNFHKLINPRSLAYWFMDDGTGGEHAYRLNTHCFTYDDQMAIILVLKEKFNIICTIQKDHGKFRINITTLSIDLFKDLIRPYMIDCFFYKINEKNNI